MLLISNNILSPLLLLLRAKVRRPTENDLSSHFNRSSHPHFPLCILISPSFPHRSYEMQASTTYILNEFQRREEGETTRLRTVRALGEERMRLSFLAADWDDNRRYRELRFAEPEEVLSMTTQFGLITSSGESSISHFRRMITAGTRSSELQPGLLKQSRQYMELSKLAKVADKYGERGTGSSSPQWDIIISQVITDLQKRRDKVKDDSSANSMDLKELLCQARVVHGLASSARPQTRYGNALLGIHVKNPESEGYVRQGVNNWTKGGLPSKNLLKQLGDLCLNKIESLRDAQAEATLPSFYRKARTAQGREEAMEEMMHTTFRTGSVTSNDIFLIGRLCESDLVDVALAAGRDARYNVSHFLQHPQLTMNRDIVNSLVCSDTFKKDETFVQQADKVRQTSAGFVHGLVKKYLDTHYQNTIKASESVIAQRDYISDQLTKADGGLHAFWTFPHQLWEAADVAWSEVQGDMRSRIEDAFPEQEVAELSKEEVEVISPLTRDPIDTLLGVCRDTKAELTDRIAQMTLNASVSNPQLSASKAKKKKKSKGGQSIKDEDPVDRANAQWVKWGREPLSTLSQVRKVIDMDRTRASREK